MNYKNMILFGFSIFVLGGTSMTLAMMQKMIPGQFFKVYEEENNRLSVISSVVSELENKQKMRPDQFFKTYKEIQETKNNGTLQKEITTQPKININMNMPLSNISTKREIKISFEKCNPSMHYYCTYDREIKDVPAGLKSTNGLQMIDNHLLNLDYSYCFKKNTMDPLHNFPEIIEKKFGDLAYVFIKTNDYNQIVDSEKRMQLYITIPGKINTIEKEDDRWNIIRSEQGVFEFKVKKSLYEEKGVCLHRFFNPKGTVGAQAFGVKERTKQQKKLNGVLTLTNKS